jgi:hypothetical protein
MGNYWEQVQLEAMIEEAKQTDSPERLRALVYSHSEVTQAVAKNPHTPAALLVELSKLDEYQLKLALLQNMALPLECFAGLTTNAYNIAKALAVCPRTPPELLRSLAQNPHREVIIALAENPQSPPDLLETLSNHYRTEVYKAAQKNPNNPLYVEGTPNRRWTRNLRPQDGFNISATPALVVDDMVRNGNFQQRYAALQGRLSPEQMSILARDEMLSIQETLARNQPLPEEVFRFLVAKDAPSIKRELTYNEKLSEEQRRFVLDLMFQSEQRAMIVSNPLLRPEQIQELSQDPLISVRRVFASNRTLTQEQIERFLNDPELSVREALRYNPFLSEETRQQIRSSLQPIQPQYNPTPVTPRPEPTVATPVNARAITPLLERVQPKPTNTTVLGISFLMLSFAFMLLYASTGSGFCFLPMMTFIFLGLGMLSMNATKKQRELRKLLGFLLLFSSIVSLPFLIVLGAPPFIVGLFFFFIIVGFFMMITA